MSSDPYTIRDARESDVKQLSTLITELGYPSTADEVRVRFASISKNADYRTLVVAEEDLLIGMAGLAKGYWFEQNGTYVRILALVVSKDQRGKGIGKILLKAVEDWAVEIGANTVLLNSGNRDERIPAFRFYQANGYEIKSSGFMKEV